jgi:hypothetical protein
LSCIVFAEPTVDWLPFLFAAMIGGQIALHHQDPTRSTNEFNGTTTTTISEGIPLSMMVGLREVVAQQEGFRSAFFRFAPRCESSPALASKQHAGAPYLVATESC